MAAVYTHHGNKVDHNLAAQPMDDLTITQDIAYLPGDRHSLDIYAPIHPAHRAPSWFSFMAGGMLQAIKPT